MDHDSVIEAIELAALEPSGLDRLMAGDTAMSQAVAGHLAGCPTCAAELASTDRESRIVADVVATTPSADLRARTLALVELRGLRRGDRSGDQLDDGRSETDASIGSPAAAAMDRPPRPRRTGWVAAAIGIAAVVALSVGVTAAVVTDRQEAERAAQAETVADLARVTRATVSVASQPDAITVALTGTQDPAMAGTIVYSPTSADLVVVATGMTEPPAGTEYSCWVDPGTGRVRLGKMFFGGGLAYWVGDSPPVEGLTSPAEFGVSLVEVGSSSMDPPPVLIGRS